MDGLLNKIRNFLLWGMAICSAAVLPMNAQAQEPVIIDRIVAVVNDEIITLYDLNQTLKPYEQNIQALGYPPEKERETLFKLRADLLNKMIDETLSDQQIKKNNIQVSAQEVDKTIERIKEGRSYTDEELRAGLAEQGLTIEEYRENLTKQLLRGKLVNREVRSKIVITGAEIEKYYNDHIEKYAGETKYHLWNIFIQFSRMADESLKQFAYEKMETVLRQLKQGRSFESLAAEKPDSPDSPGGADLGLYRIDELSPQLQSVVKNMKEGEYSAILNMAGGYQIIYVQEVLAADPKSLSDVKAEIEDILYNQAVDSRYNTWLSELRKRSHIRIIQ